MSVRDLYRVLLRLMGVFYFVQYVMAHLNLVYYAVSNNNGLSEIFGSLFAFITVLVVTMFLIFRTDKVIKMFQLDTGLDSNQIATSNITTDALFKFVFVLLGVLLVMDNVVGFIILPKKKAKG
ncbi:MAG: hypothetical protein ACI9UJ_002106 [bacterium]|jgi:uncharacterized membrane protein